MNTGPSKPRILNALIIAANAVVLGVVVYVGYWGYRLNFEPLAKSTVSKPFLITAGILALVNLASAFFRSSPFAQKLRLRGSLVPALFLAAALWDQAPVWFLPAGIVAVTVLLPRLFPTRLFPER